MKVNQTPRIIGDLSVVREFADHAALLNLITDGRISGVNNATTAAPSGGSYAPGDIVRNSAPAEAGSAGSRYVVLGWLCVDDSPLAFVELRCLTGN